MSGWAKQFSLGDHNFAHRPIGKRLPIHIDHLNDLHIVVEMECPRAMGTLPRHRTDFHRGVHVQRTHSESFLTEPATSVTQGHRAAVDQPRLYIAYASLEHGFG